MTLLSLVGCDAIASFGGFKFGSDGGMKSDYGGSDGSVADAGSVDAGSGCGSGASERVCDDHVDNDCDGLEDCQDPDCSNDVHCCQPTEIPETSCSGGVDNDCDGLIDCADPDCSSADACCHATGAEVGNTACGDGVDNDCDGILDCKEMSCAAQAVCCVPSGSESDTASCGDGIDNDCDGKKDCNDPDCAVVSSCCVKSEDAEKSCGDAKDNDCDGLTDCRDPDCVADKTCSECVPTSKTETNCMDLVDNDCDKDRDCLDSDCAHDPACCVPSGPEDNAIACVDGVDNDCDGLLDCADPNCASTLDCCVASGPESGSAACTDSVDNDCDGLINCQDPGCAGVQNCCQTSGPETGMTACSDGVDNDCDGNSDCSDSDCAGFGACCTPSGTEASQPNDGKDNDCDGFTDIPILTSAYPTGGLPASGDEVALTFAPSIVGGASLECSSRRRGLPNQMAVFVACSGSGNVVKPQTASAASDPGNDGAWVTDVRWRFPNGARSATYSFKYYIHHTLYKAKKCTTPIKDADWIAKAATRLNSPAALPFSPTDTLLTSPFIRVTYQPPNANSIRIEFEQDGSAQKVEIWSLRHRFVLSADNKYLLILRNYASSRTGNCFAARFKIHAAQHAFANLFQNVACDAIVLNRQGAGVCLKNAAGLPAFAQDTNDNYQNSIGWSGANKFMWRQLDNELYRGDVHPFSHDEGASYRNFTPKCSVLPCANPYAIYLPDRALF